LLSAFCEILFDYCITLLIRRFPVLPISNPVLSRRQELPPADMASEKPTLVFIPGAWHTPEYFEGVISQLKAHGYPVRALRMPSVGGDDTSTMADDAAYIQKTTSALAAEGKEIILVMHSYGGIPGTQSAKGLLQKERAAEGQRGGIIGLVYLAAFLLPAGQSLASFLGSMPDWVKYNVSIAVLGFCCCPSQVGEFLCSAAH